MSLHSKHVIMDIETFRFPDKPCYPSSKPAKFDDRELMKNKDRIEQLEKQVAVLTNRVQLLEMRLNPMPTSAPPEWPTWKPFWLDGPQYPSETTKPYRIIPMMDTQCSLHH